MNEPLYEIVKQHVMDHISKSALKPGDKVPSENQIVREFNVSRMTANRALRELTDEGYLIREHGRGTFVAPNRMKSHPLKISSISDAVRDRNENYSVKVLTIQKIMPSIDVSVEFIANLGFDENQTLIHLQLVHKSDGIPIQLEDRYVRYCLAPGLLVIDLELVSPSQYLLGKVPMYDGEHVVRAEMPEPAISSALEMPSNEPLLTIDRRTYTVEGLASVTKLYHPASRFELSGEFSGSE